MTLRNRRHPTPSAPPRRLGTAVAFLAALASSVAAHAAAPKISDPDLFAKSLNAARQALAFYGEYDDREQLARVNDLGYRVAQEADFDAFPFSFYLVDMPVPNAFALPGGHIFVTRGMLDLGLDDDMLAGLLGHEIAHVTKRHGLRIQKRATLLNVLSQALLVGVMIAADGGEQAPPPGTIYGDPRYGSSDGNRVMGAAAAGVVVSELLLRSYSREFEDEADDEGQRLAAGAGFDPSGTAKLMSLMKVRLPQSQEYGYWRTHPFFEQRVRSASVREDLLEIQPPSSADAYRQATQKTLLDFAGLPKTEPELVDVLEWTALSAWPKGAAAGQIRLGRLHEQRAAEIGKAELARDFGRLIAAYDREIEEVRELEPEAPVLATLEAERAELGRQRDELYATALEVYHGGVFETGFLRTFASNYPDAPEYPAVALDLGDAYSRLQRPADAVAHYLEAWRQAPESEAGKRALAGLRAMAPVLERLDALQELARQEDDELRRRAETRLEQVASTFKELANGAAYVRRYPDGPYRERVSKRLDKLADDLYGEVVLYQTVGDHAKALDRIQRILTQAPLSPAAERLRERAVLAS